MTSSAPLRSILGPVWFNILINEIEKVLRASTASLQVSGEADTPEGWEAFQRELHKLNMGILGSLVTPSTRGCTRVRASAQAEG